MFCFLMLYKDLLIIKISITIPAPWLQLLLLLATHNCASKAEEKGSKRIKTNTPRSPDLTATTASHRKQTQNGRRPRSRLRLPAGTAAEGGARQGWSHDTDLRPEWVETRGLPEAAAILSKLTAPFLGALPGPSRVLFKAAGDLA